MNKLKIKRTVLPPVKLTFAEWIKELKVSSMYVKKHELSNKGQKFLNDLRDLRQ